MGAPHTWVWHTPVADWTNAVVRLWGEDKKNYRSLYGSLPPEVSKGDKFSLIGTCTSSNADALRCQVCLHLRSTLILVLTSWISPIPFLQLASPRFAKSSWEIMENKLYVKFSPMIKFSSLWLWSVEFWGIHLQKPGWPQQEKNPESSELS